MPIDIRDIDSAVRIRASFRQLSDLYLLAEGGYAPVRRFQSGREVRQVAETMRLADGSPWSIPIVFPLTAEEAAAIGRRDEIRIEDQHGQAAGLLHISEIFRLDKSHYARHVFRTEDPRHPGVEWLLNAGESSAAGEVELAAGWKKVVGFQTRNPIHRAHEFVTKTALETADGLVIHPLLGETKPDDTPVEVRLACYRALVDNYYSASHTMIAGFPAWMRYAGPREAIFHAQVRRNYGITHLIVGRDHAGVGDYYGPFDAQTIFSEFAPGELGIEPVFFDAVHYCRQCGAMTSPKTCPHGQEHHLSLSGTAVRQMLGEGKMLPPEFSRPEVAAILMESGAHA